MGRGREGPIQAHGYILGQEVEGLLAPSGTGTRGPPALSVTQRVNQPHALWGRSRTAQNTTPTCRAVAPPATAGKPKTRVRGSRGCLQVTPQQGQDGDLIRTPSPLPAPRRLSCRTGPRTPQSPPGPGVPRPQGHPHQELTGGGAPHKTEGAAQMWSLATSEMALANLSLPVRGSANSPASPKLEDTRLVWESDCVPGPHGAGGREPCAGVRAASGE